MLSKTVENRKYDLEVFSQLWCIVGHTDIVFSFYIFLHVIFLNLNKHKISECQFKTKCIYNIIMQEWFIMKNKLNLKINGIMNKIYFLFTYNILLDVLNIFN